MIKEVGRLNSEKTTLEEQLETLQARKYEMISSLSNIFLAM